MKTGGPSTGKSLAKADKRNPRGAALSPSPRTASVADPTNLESNKDDDNTSSRGSTELHSSPADLTCSLCHSRMAFIPIITAGSDPICPLCQSNKNIVSRYNLRHASSSGVRSDTSCPGCEGVSGDSTN